MLMVAFKFFEVAVSQIQTEEFFFNDLGFSCNSDEFECDNGQCVASSLRCDGDLACTDNSDERDCACLSSELKCGNGNCVRVNNLCDGVQHCPDGSDEANCGREHQIYVMNSKGSRKERQPLPLYPQIVLVFFLKMVCHCSCLLQIVSLHFVI